MSHRTLEVTQGFDPRSDSRTSATGTSQLAVHTRIGPGMRQLGTGMVDMWQSAQRWSVSHSVAIRLHFLHNKDLKQRQTFFFSSFFSEAKVVMIMLWVLVLYVNVVCTGHSA